MRRYSSVCRFILGAGLLFMVGQVSHAKPDVLLGDALPDETVDALFILKTPNEKALERLAQAVNDPSSPRYGQFLTAEQIRGRYGAPAAALQQATRYFKAQGLKAEVDSMGLWLKVTLDSQRLKSLTGARLKRYRSGLTARTFLKPEGIPSVPEALRSVVGHIEGLDQTPIQAPRPKSVPKHPAIQSKALSKALADGSGPPFYGAYNSAGPNLGSPKGCAAGLVPHGETNWPPGLYSAQSYTPNQWLTAYGLTDLHARGLNGTGERLAVIEIDGFRAQDIATFDACFGFNLLPIYAHTYPEGPELAPGGETTLDLEIISAVAPGLERVDVWQSTDGKGQADPSTPSLARTFKAAVFDGPRSDRPTVVSISLYMCETGVTVGTYELLEKLFKRAALSGVSVFVASGDLGVTTCRANGSTIANWVAVGYPASSPWVTAVGGTNLLLNPDNTIRSEVVWNDPLFLYWIIQDLFPLMTPEAGTGGISQLFPMPKWQQALQPSVFQGSTTRGVPDVALLADAVPGYSIFLPLGDGLSAWQAIGGTSAATPLMASATALMNQSLRQNHKARLGFLAPVLYRIGLDAESSAKAFNDVTFGNNNTTWQTPLGSYDPSTYSAQEGYDLASGWGSPRFPQLLEVLNDIKRKK